jgi:hypothetical protein
LEFVKLLGLRPHSFYIPELSFLRRKAIVEVFLLYPGLSFVVGGRLASRDKSIRNRNVLRTDH